MSFKYDIACSFASFCNVRRRLATALILSDMKVNGAPGAMTLVVQTFQPGIEPHMGQLLDMWPIWQHLKQALHKGSQSWKNRGI